MKNMSLFKLYYFFCAIGREKNKTFIFWLTTMKDK